MPLASPVSRRSLDRICPLWIGNRVGMDGTAASRLRDDTRAMIKVSGAKNNARSYVACCTALLPGISRLVRCLPPKIATTGTKAAVISTTATLKATTGTTVNSRAARNVFICFDNAGRIAQRSDFTARLSNPRHGKTRRRQFCATGCRDTANSAQTISAIFTNSTCLAHSQSSVVERYSRKVGSAQIWIVANPQLDAKAIANLRSQLFACGDADRLDSYASGFFHNRRAGLWPDSFNQLFLRSVSKGMFA